MSYDRRDVLSGAIFMTLGGAFAFAAQRLELGTALRMGPGYFPLVLSGILILLGLLIAARGFGREGEPVGTIAWRGMLLILPAPIVFGLTVRGLGFVGAVLLTAAIAVFASRTMRATPAALIVVGIAVFSTAAFSYALGLPIPRVGPWLRF